MTLRTFPQRPCRARTNIALARSRPCGLRSLARNGTAPHLQVFDLAPVVRQSSHSPGSVLLSTLVNSCPSDEHPGRFPNFPWSNTGSVFRPWVGRIFGLPVHSLCWLDLCRRVARSRAQGQGPCGRHRRLPLTAQFQRRPHSTQHRIGQLCFLA